MCEESERFGWKIVVALVILSVLFVASHFVMDKKGISMNVFCFVYFLSAIVVFAVVFLVLIKIQKDYCVKKNKIRFVEKLVNDVCGNKGENEKILYSRTDCEKIIKHLTDCIAEV